MNINEHPNSFEDLLGKLGFGTSGLMGSALTDRGRVEILNLAFENGVRHFDTAPLYGQGEAERVVGLFLKNKRSEVTITSKFGLLPQRIPAVLRPLRPLARYLNSHLKPIRPYVGSALQRIRRTTEVNTEEVEDVRAVSSSVLPQESSFKLEELESELNSSMAQLGVDHIDYYLFHECFDFDVSEALLASLNKLVRSGKIGSYGIATSLNETSKILNAHPEFDGVVQAGFSTNLIENAGKSIASLFVHSAFRNEMFLQLCQLSDAQPNIIESMLQTLNLHNGLDNPPISICLNAALHDPAIGKLIFSSTKPEHIEQTVRALDPAFCFSQFGAARSLMS